MLFKKSKQVNSEEYERIMKRLIEIEGVTAKLEGEFVIMTTNQNSLRGLINRKLGDAEMGTESNKNRDPFDSIRGLKP